MDDARQERAAEMTDAEWAAHVATWAVYPGEEAADAWAEDAQLRHAETPDPYADPRGV